MNCHGNHGHYESNGNKNGHGKRGHLFHMLLMILCCVLPMMLVVFLPLFKINSAALRSALPFAVSLLCPLMHVLMIPMMFRRDKNEGKDGESHFMN